MAPHRGAVLGSPAGLPFFSHPRRFAWGSLIAISFIPLPPVLASCRHCAHNGLAATMYVYVFDRAVLFPFAAILFQYFHLGRKCPQQPIGVAHTNVNTMVGLIFHRRVREELHREVVNANHLHGQKRLRSIASPKRMDCRSGAFVNHRAGSMIPESGGCLQRQNDR
jgi:hypothetical protein